MTSILQLRAGIRTEAQIPDYAAAFGITQTVIYDDFETTNQIDINDTRVDGYTWYVGNPPSWQGIDPFPDPVSIYNTDYTVSGSVLNVLNSPGTTNNGLQFAQRSFSHTIPTIPTGSVPTISGARPFYVESYLKSDVVVQPAWWMADIGIIEQSINNTGSVIGAEFDTFECFNATAATFSIHKWSGPSTFAPQQSTNITNSLWVKSQFNKWGVLCVPRAFNGGTGLVRHYLNRVQSNVPDYTYTTDSANIEGSNFIIMFCAALNSANPIAFQYIAGWVNPP